MADFILRDFQVLSPPIAAAIANAEASQFQFILEPIGAKSNRGEYLSPRNNDAREAVERATSAFSELRSRVFGTT